MVKLYSSGGVARLTCPQAAKRSGHLADVHFVWVAGSEHVEHHAAELTCPCGKALVHVSGSDPWQQPFVEVEGEPHGA